MAPPMPKPRAETQENENLAGLFKKITTEGLDVAHAELDLARAEAINLAQIYVTGVILCVVSFVFAISTTVLMGQATALFLQRYIHSLVGSYLVTGIIMLISTLLLAWLGFKQFKQKITPVGTIFTWMTGQTRHEKHN